MNNSRELRADSIGFSIALIIAKGYTGRNIALTAKIHFSMEVGNLDGSKRGENRFSKSLIRTCDTDPLIACSQQLIAYSSLTTSRTHPLVISSFASQVWHLPNSRSII